MVRQRNLTASGFEAFNRFGDSKPGMGVALRASISITDAAPNAGEFKWDTVAQTDAAFLYVSTTAADGTDLSAALAGLASGQRFQLSQAEDTARWQTFRMTGAPVSATGYYKLPVALVAATAGVVSGYVPILTGGARGSARAGGAMVIFDITGSGGGAGGASAWGDITGTLSAQTDLQAALDDKADGPLELTGDVTGTQTPGDPQVAATLAASGVVAGLYTAANITVDAKGRITAAASSGGAAATPSDFKDSVEVATTANITLSGEQTIDGVLTAGSRVLVKNQTLPAQNGIYVSDAGAWSRSTDADTDAEVTSGVMVYAEGGTVGGGLVYLLSTLGVIVVGTTALTFTPIALPFAFFVGKTVAGTTYTGILTDSGKRLNLTNVGTKTVTVPPQGGGVAYPVNTEIEVFNVGAGLATLAPGAGVTLNSVGAKLTIEQYVGVKLKNRANPNTWDVTSIIPTAVAAAGDADAIVRRMYLNGTIY